MGKKQRRNTIRCIVAGALFLPAFIVAHTGTLGNMDRWWVALFFASVYLLIGYDILLAAVGNVGAGQVFDENLLMAIATVAAFAIGQWEEAVAVMLFYQVGELFQSYAVDKSRRSIKGLMDICPTYANVETEDGLQQVDPDDVAVGSVILIKAGEKIPLDGVVIEGSSMIDTAALTGEPVPRRVSVGQEVISGCINGSNPIKVQVTKAFEDSTVSRILELVENASSKKAKTEKFITRFARVYTPAVTLSAIALSVIPPLLFGGQWQDWILRGCTFLVISCPCALVISVPLGFFGGIGAASKQGILVKGGNYLEAVAQLERIAFDKTGTLTKGQFQVSGLYPQGITEEELLDFAAHGEGYSTHPIASAIVNHYGNALDLSRLGQTQELAGRGICATLDGKPLYLGSAALMKEQGLTAPSLEGQGTVVYAAYNGMYVGAIVISDQIKEESKEAIALAKGQGIQQTIMLTGDTQQVAKAVGQQLGIHRVCAQLLPGDKVTAVEALLQEKGKLAFVGDGINDAPVLMRSDVGIAMGSLGSDAAIEAADVVIIDDDLRKIPALIRIARKTMAIVRQNIVFALGVKGIVLALGAFGFANMWASVFADVGVSVIAICNSMRTLNMN